VLQIAPGEITMTTVQITLPDQLAQEAQRAVLSPEEVAQEIRAMRTERRTRNAS
jgi:hypothetical protein